MQSNKKLWVALVVVAIIAIGGYFFPQVKAFVGAVGTRFQHGLSVGTNTATTANGLKLGDNGTEITSHIVGTCTLKADVSIAATSTGFAYCSGITGLVSTSKVFISLSTTTGGVAGIANQYVPVAAQASTTATGAFDVKLLNLTGTAAIPSATASFGSTTRYDIYN